jgi:hypothetical protein
MLRDRGMAAWKTAETKDRVSKKVDKLLPQERQPVQPEEGRSDTKLLLVQVTESSEAGHRQCLRFDIILLRGPGELLSAVAVTISKPVFATSRHESQDRRGVAASRPTSVRL